ncbi:MAG: hypothetical protein VX589_01060 [Myxococcota bacterium]|nr:hypothetical protein [Myxococcota bacterium]
MKAFITVLVVSFLGQACGGSANRLTQSERAELRARAQASHTGETRPSRAKAQRDSAPAIAPEVVSKTLPSVPANALWGDGVGATLHEAVIDGRRVVSEQIVAQLSSESRSFESSSNRGEEFESSLRITSVSEFQHAELIKTVGAIRTKTGFVARVVLSRSEAIEAYQTDVRELTKRLSRLAPILKRGIETFDTAILLNARYSPRLIYTELLRAARILRFLGDEYQPRMPTSIAELENRAGVLRSAAVIRVRLEGNGSARLKNAIAGEISQALAAQGCTLNLESIDTPSSHRATAILNVQVASRNHRELGVYWRYVGLQLAVRDSASGQTFATLSAMPEFVHGGGPSWPMADQAVVRRIGAELKPRIEQSGLTNLYCDSL